MRQGHKSVCLSVCAVGSGGAGARLNEVVDDLAQGSRDLHDVPRDDEHALAAAVGGLVAVVVVAALPRMRNPSR